MYVCMYTLIGMHLREGNSPLTKKLLGFETARYIIKHITAIKYNMN